MVKQCYDKTIVRNSGEVHKFQTGYMRYQVDQVADEKGQLQRKVVFKYYDTSEDNKKFKSSDFSLNSILSVGAFDMLKPVVMSRMSDMTLADKFENYSFTQSHGGENV